MTFYMHTNIQLCMHRTRHLKVGHHYAHSKCIDTAEQEKVKLDKVKEEEEPNMQPKLDSYFIKCYHFVEFISNWSLFYFLLCFSCARCWCVCCSSFFFFFSLLSLLRIAFDRFFMLSKRLYKPDFNTVH